MKLFNDMKARVFVRLFCKIAKSRGLEMDDVVAMIEEEWEKA